MEDEVVYAKFKDDKLIFGVQKLDKLSKDNLFLLRKGLTNAIDNIDELEGGLSEICVLDIKIRETGMGIVLNKDVIENMPDSMIETLMAAFQKTMTEVLDIKGISHEIKIQKMEMPLRSVPKNEVN